MATKKPNALMGFGPVAKEEEEQASYKELRAARIAKAAKSPTKRQHKVFMMTPEQAEQLDAYCFHGKTTIQATILEALDMLYRAKGLPPLKQDK
jgi:hypothetical protein